jgi:hypothetical protein
VLAGGTVTDWADATSDNDMPLPASCRRHRHAADLAVLPYTSGTTGNAQGLHAPAPQPDAQRGGQLPLGQQHLENVTLLGGADVPHHRHGVA